MTFHELETTLDHADACEHHRLASLDRRARRIDSRLFIVATIGAIAAWAFVLVAMFWK